ncbi:hypothetical protein [Vibrio furnissii]|nr:hypothetical protein [Vibrio furnissii]
MIAKTMTAKTMTAKTVAAKKYSAMSEKKRAQRALRSTVSMQET